MFVAPVFPAVFSVAPVVSVESAEFAASADSVLSKAFVESVPEPFKKSVIAFSISASEIEASSPSFFEITLNASKYCSSVASTLSLAAALNSSAEIEPSLFVSAAFIIFSTSCLLKLPSTPAFCANDFKIVQP